MKTVNPIHQSDRLHRDAGTYYRSAFADAGRLYSLFDSVSWANQLMLDDALDASKLFVRTLIPPVHRERFLPIRVDEPTYREGKKRILLYGLENARYGDDLYYGHHAQSIPGAIELPDGVVDVDLCCDLPVDPGVVLVKNEHFFLRGAYLYFTDDLFDIMPVSEGTVTFYLRGVSIDRRYVQDRLGILLRTRGESTRDYLDFNNLALDCVIEGTNYHRLAQLICKLYDVPCTKETETVERTGIDRTRRWQATDRAVYFAPLSARFLFESGDTLQAGTILTDAIRPIRGTVLEDGIPIVFERRFLGNGYGAGLIFPNEETPLQIDGRFPYPTFRIVGREEDVRRFWQTFYSRTSDRSILSAAAGGMTINPAKFIYANVLYPKAQFYLVRRQRCGPNPLPKINTRIFRNLLPPGILFSILLVGSEPTFALELPNIESTRTLLYSTAPTVTGTLSPGITNLSVKTC